MSHNHCLSTSFCCRRMFILNILFFFGVYLGQNLSEKCCHWEYGLCVGVISLSYQLTPFQSRICVLPIQFNSWLSTFIWLLNFFCCCCFDFFAYMIYFTNREREKSVIAFATESDLFTLIYKTHSPSTLYFFFSHFSTLPQHFFMLCFVWF